MINIVYRCFKRPSEKCFSDGLTTFLQQRTHQADGIFYEAAEFGALLPWFDGNVAAVFEVVTLEVADLFGGVTIVDGEADFEVEEEAAHVHIDRTEEGVVFVYGQGFGM